MKESEKLKKDLERAEYDLERARVSLDRAAFQRMLVVEGVHSAQINEACKPLQYMLEVLLPYAIQCTTADALEELLFFNNPDMESYKELLMPIIRKERNLHIKALINRVDRFHKSGELIEWQV
jgi:hypothetical protein